MKKIEAIIKPYKVTEVKDSLHEMGLSGMTIIDVKGFGRQRGKEGIQNHDDDEFHSKIMIEIIVENENTEKAVKAIQKSAFSGKIGDGKIFISNIEEVIRIRTGEKGNDAV
tara:strand:- start:106 stop:438 length:333 start_codon:yes stop_codon:yes gene_type:complete